MEILKAIRVVVICTLNCSNLTLKLARISLRCGLGWLFCASGKNNRKSSDIQCGGIAVSTAVGTI